CRNLIVERGVTTMELMEVILTKENLNRAYKKVVANKGASGIDEITVEELGSYIRENQEAVINSLRNRTKIFSEYSYGFRPNRSCHDASKQALGYLNDGHEWIIDLDIEQFFDKVNHDKLIQILREQVNDSSVLNLIRKYLKAGVMEEGIVKATKTGIPQGGPVSVILLNVYLDKLDKELEERGLRFVRYADDGAPRRRVQVA
ncbi:MAG: reverse transcriptase domain-containing protein, partial [Anaerocolumna sp.]